MAAQRAAGDALAGTLKAQLSPSALLPASPAAKAALDAVMQNKRNVAAAISMVSLMVRSSRIRDIGCTDGILSPNARLSERNKIRPGPCIKTMHALHNRDPRRVSIAALSAYDSAGFELRDAHIVRSIAPDELSRT
jgi:hypothetical protein